MIQAELKRNKTQNRPLSYPVLEIGRPACPISQPNTLIENIIEKPNTL